MASQESKEIRLLHFLIFFIFIPLIYEPYTQIKSYGLFGFLYLLSYMQQIRIQRSILHLINQVLRVHA